MGALQVIILAILGLIPLAVPAQNFGYEEVKVYLFTILLSLALVIWLKLILKKELPFRLTKVNILSLVFLGILLLSAVLGFNFKVSFWGREPYFQGWVLFLGLCLFSVILSSINLNLKSLILSYSLAAGVVSVLAIKDFLLLQLGEPILTYSGRVVSTFGQPNFYSGFLIFLLPWQYYIALKIRSLRILLLGLMGLEVAAIVISSSKVTLFLLGLLCLLLLISRLKIWLKILVVSLTVVSLISVLFASWYFQKGLVWEELDRPPRRDYFYYEFPVRGFYFWQFKWTKNPEKRIYIYPVVVDLIFQKPLLGYGLDNLLTNFAKSDLSHFHGLDNLAIDRSHNFTLDLLFFSGVTGLFSWLLLLWVAVNSQRSKIWLSSLMLYLIWVQFHNQSSVHLIYFWLLIGLSNQDLTIK